MIRPKPNNRNPLGKRIDAAAQVQLLIALLRQAPRNTHELRRKGISHSGGRIQDLRDRGWVITTDRVVTVDSDGFTHTGVALYTLVSEPGPSRPPQELPGTNRDLFAQVGGATA